MSSTTFSAAKTDKYIFNYSKLLLSALILIISYFSLFKGYEYPNKLFWDENYHIAAAQKYLNGVFFMEPHPPLGKLLIALGELILDKNTDDDDFIGTDYARNLPDDFSFEGYRFFPAALASLCPLLVFFILSQHIHFLLSFFFALLLATENAFIVHVRSAMLEGSQIFFMLCFFLVLSIQLNTAKDKRHRSIFFMAAFLAATLAVKINAVVLFIPAFFLLLSCSYKFKAFLAFIFGFVTVYLAIWMFHIHIATRIVDTLPNSGLYQASDKYKLALISNGEFDTNDLIKIKENIQFLFHYTKGVPDLNLCKPGDNGSPWYWWPLGGKSIRYRYDSNGEFTQYLTLAVNPVSWWLSLCGVILGLSFSLASLFSAQNFSFKSVIFLRILSLSWFIYILIATTSGRVLYLYHYFIPVFLGWFMLAVIISEVRQISSFRVNNLYKGSCCLILIAAQLLAYFFFSPLTYYKPLNAYELAKRNWLSVWNIVCVSCKDSFPVAKVLVDPNIDRTPAISISNINAIETYQEWGKPRMNLTVTDKKVVVNSVSYANAIGVNSRSKITFINNKDLTIVKGKVGLPDYLIKEGNGSVVFRISGDGRQLWISEILRPGDMAKSFAVDIKDYRNIVLEVDNAGDNNNHDHGLWLEPEFETSRKH